MNREQCKAVAAHIDLIRHFAAGGDIGHRLFDYDGNLVRTSPCRGIGLSGLHADGSTLYVKVKPKFRKNTEYGHMERVERSPFERLEPHEIIPYEVEVFTP